MSATRRPALRLATALLGLVLLLTGCSKLGLGGEEGGKGGSKPVNGEPPADSGVEALATALVKGDLSAVDFVGDQATARKAAQDDYKVIMGGMDGILPAKVTNKGIVYKGAGVAQASLEQLWYVGGKEWKYTSTAMLNLSDKKWMVAWQPSIVHPQLTSQNRMRHTRDLPDRAGIFDKDGKAIMEDKDLVVVGLDKANLDKAKWSSSARTLAQEAKVDEAAYEKKVQNSGEKAFVPAATLTQHEVTAGMLDVPGFMTQDAKGTRTISPGFALSIVGVVGRATAEQARASKGAVMEGDQIGLTGLQKRYDAQLRGTSGHTITLVKRKNAPEPKKGEDPHVDITVYSHDPVPGKQLDLTLGIEEQQKAEAALAGVGPVASMVVIDTKNGGILAAANSKKNEANPDATFGRYAPGSTFKVVTALALVRQGMSAGSMVECTPTLTVNGRTFKNYNDYPSDKLGSITLREAIANSCNTAFMAQAKSLPKGALEDAAASLGMGVDYDAGFPIFYGSVPATDDPVTKAANTIGQGQVEGSPVAMAGVAASVKGGKTLVPWMVKGHTPKPKATPLTENEANQLREMMKGTVEEGSARFLQPKGVEGAKTGTAEFGSDNPPKTHAWMIVYKGDIAIAVMVAEGVSGSQTAGPIIEKYLS